MFRTAMCPSSGELLYQCDTWFMSLCVDDRLVCRSICSATSQQTHTESHELGVALIQQFSWWWAHGCPKHVQKRNKHTRKHVRQFVYLQGSYQDARSTKHKIQRKRVNKLISCFIKNQSNSSPGWRCQYKVNDEWWTTRGLWFDSRGGWIGGGRRGFYRMSKHLSWLCGQFSFLFAENRSILQRVKRK